MTSISSAQCWAFFRVAWQPEAQGQTSRGDRVHSRTRRIVFAVQAVGFLRSGDDPEQQLLAVMGRRGLLQVSAGSEARLPAAIVATCELHATQLWSRWPRRPLTLDPCAGTCDAPQFWDCCGAEQEDAPGCTFSFHQSFDEELNERNGWSSAHR